MPQAMNHSPDILTCLMGLAAPHLNWIPPTTSVSQLSLETTKLLEMMWSRLTITPMDNVGPFGVGELRGIHHSED